MITLNLISPSQKKELRLLRIFIVIKNVIIYLLLFLIIVAIILLISKMVLQNNFNRIVAQYNLNTRTGKLFSQDIKLFNQKIRTIKTIQNGYVAWSDKLVSLTRLVPEDIVIYSMNINKDTKDISITGRAKNRQVLLDFQQTLNNSDYFENIEIPLSSLLKKENIDFTISSKFLFDKN